MYPYLNEWIELNWKTHTFHPLLLPMIERLLRGFIVRELGNGLVDRPGNVHHVGGVEAADVDAARLQQVDVELLHEVLGLALREPGVGEQADLFDDMLPAAWGFESGTKYWLVRFLLQAFI